MKNIYRWGLMRNTKQENLSEHSLEVAQIAHALALIGNKRLSKSYNPDFIATVAMYHDTSEIITGDMPTPIKYYNDEIKAVYKQIESTAEKQLTEMLPEDFRDEFYKIYNPDKETALLVKAADKISALIKCTEELNMGNNEFKIAHQSTLKSIESMGLKEAEIFLCEFLPAFSLSLDELRQKP
jgi:5'-deoxynucleotidase